MPKRISKSEVVATLNKAADIIRQAGEIDIGSLSLMLEKSVSWINNYRPVMLKMFTDISYEHGKFKALTQEHEAYPIHLREEREEHDNKQ